MFYLLILASLFASVHGHAKYMVCSTPVNPNPTLSPVVAPATGAPVNKVYQWTFPTYLFNNSTRAYKYSKVSPGMPLYVMNVPPTVSPSSYALAKGFYSNNLTITAARSNGNLLTSNYSYYVPNENLTLTLGSKWANTLYLKAEALVALNETGDGKNSFLVFIKCYFLIAVKTQCY